MSQSDAQPGTPVPSEDAAGFGEPGRGRLVFLWIVMLVLAVGVGHRTIQYLAVVDLWHDEIALIRNVEDRGYVQLVSEPLDHLQMAPAGYLLLLKVGTEAGGLSTASIRFIPWLFGIASLFLFWRIAARYAGGWNLVAVMAIFAVSPALVWYGTSVKPYGSDVMMSVLLAWLALRSLEAPDSMARAIAAGLLGGIALLISFPAVPTAAPLGIFLVATWWFKRPRTSIWPLVVLGAGWCVGAAFTTWYATGQLGTETDAFMREFWAEDFPPANLVGAVSWMMLRSWEVFGHSLVFVPPDNPVLGFIVTVPMVLAIAGVLIAMMKRAGFVIVLLAAPIAAWTGALLHLLPFDGRLGLHAAWPVLVLAGYALTRMHSGRRAWRWVSRVLAFVMAVPLVLITLLAARPPYLPPGDTTPREVLEELAVRHRAGDVIYVYTQGRHDMVFYGEPAGISSWEQGERHFDDPKAYLHEVDRYRGTARVWFFWVRLDGDEPAWIHRYLETIGHELERIPPGDLGDTGAVLYDLSDEDRLSSAAAETFALPPGDAE